MRNSIKVALAVTALAAGLSACSRNERDPKLLYFGNTSTPDEFSIVPTKPLEYPESVAQLPDPTPGLPNRTDPTPLRDAAVALGGNFARSAGGLSSVDTAMIAYARRFGEVSSIRSLLAAEDLEFRRDNDGKLLERWFNVNVYARAYQPVALDSYAELKRLRALNLKTPAAPPKIEKK